jgi:hypothetical protein
MCSITSWFYFVRKKRRENSKCAIIIARSVFGENSMHARLKFGKKLEVFE